MTETKAGHCRHCHELCQVSEPGTPPQETDHAGMFSGWLDGHCPACAEAEGIAVEAEKRAEAEWSTPATYYDYRDLVARAYENIADFARGER